MDGIPALDLWDLVIHVFHSNSNQKQKIKQARSNPSSGKAFEKRVNTQFPQRHVELSNVDFVPLKVNSSHEGAVLYIYEDKESVIKMNIKGRRSRTLRHVSRTHRVALDCLLDRVHLDPKIQIRYVDSRNQLADILTRGHFKRDEWNHLLCLFNISLFCSQSCSQAMAKRPQEGDYEERVVAKSKSVRKLVSISHAGFSTVPSSTASSSPEDVGLEDHEVIVTACTGQPVSQNQESDPTKVDTMMNSQVWQTDASSMGSTEAPVAWSSDKKKN